MSESPVRKLRAEIARRKNAMKLAPFGIGEVLDVLDEYVAHVETRLTLLEGQGGAIADFAEQLNRAKQGRACEACEE
jgi:hypothetical protein